MIHITNGGQRASHPHTQNGNYNAYALCVNVMERTFNLMTEHIQTISLRYKSATSNN